VAAFEWVATSLVEVHRLVILVPDLARVQALRGAKVVVGDHRVRLLHHE
jgi:hypothetical protein